MRAGGNDTALLVEEGFVLGIRLLEYPAPVIIGCTGHAVAMGAFLLLCGDYRVGVDGPFRIVANEVAIGMTMPFTAIEFVPPTAHPRCGESGRDPGRTLLAGRRLRRWFLGPSGWVEDLVPTTASLATAVGDSTALAHTATKGRVRVDAIKAIREALEHDRASFATLIASTPVDPELKGAGPSTGWDERHTGPGGAGRSGPSRARSDQPEVDPT